MADSFAARFARARERFGPLVWGLDPSGQILEAWGLGDSPDGLDHFADVVLDAAVDTIGLVKPQSAFYERHGWRGFRTLQRLTHDAREAGLLVIVDAKRGDVGSTNDAYADAYLGRRAPVEADALTVHPYLGLGAMEAFVSRADAAGAPLLVVTRSSNPEGRSVQAASTSGGTVEEAILDEIGALNRRLRPDDPVGPVGAVIGPTTAEAPLDLPAARALFLAPGVGAQGATPSDVAQVFAACRDRVMPSASRSLLAAGPDRNRMKDEIASLGAEFRDLLVPS
jgi:orotidine-5'-phosphate decarboxylase